MIKNMKTIIIIKCKSCVRYVQISMSKYIYLEALHTLATVPVKCQLLFIHKFKGKT